MAINCDRCGAEARSTIVSMFDTDRLCIACKRDEREAPGYEAASTTERLMTQSGNRNFQGVGLSGSDAVFLALRLAARSESKE